MPLKSLRYQYLKEVEELCMELFPYRHLEHVHRRLDHLFRLHGFISYNRYWDRYPIENLGTPRPSFYHDGIISFDLRGSRHLSAFRMTHNQLLHLVSFFNDDIAFAPSGNKPQAPPLYQIGLTVYRFAHGHDVRSIARTFGVSGESVIYALCSL